MRLAAGGLDQVLAGELAARVVVGADERFGRHRPGRRDPRRPHRERDGALVGEGREDGRRRRPDQAVPGVMLALRGRLCNMVINRLHASGDGDIVVPQRGLSIVGTSSWVVEDPRNWACPRITSSAWSRRGPSSSLPADATHRAAWSAARPLIGSRGEADSGRELSRTFKTIDHAAEGGAEGFVTINGGQGHHPARDGRGLCRRRLPQAGGRRALPNTRHDPVAAYRLLRRMMATRAFRVFRFSRDNGPPRFDDFEAEIEPTSTVLDALRWIRIHRDPSLAIRHSCLHASCGTCGVV